MSSSREYDPEIKDIADYVANKTIDSELAVSFAAPLRETVGRLWLPLIFKRKKSPWSFFLSHTPPSIGIFRDGCGENKSWLEKEEKKTKKSRLCTSF